MVAWATAVKPPLSVTRTPTVALPGPSRATAEKVDALPGGLVAAVVVQVPGVGQRIPVGITAGRADKHRPAFVDRIRPTSVDRRRRVEVQPDNDRVMIGGAVPVRFIKRILGRGFEGCVVIENIRLIRVDVPFGRPR